MSTALRSLPSGAAGTAEAVLADVNSLVDLLRARAPETERLRRMHPDNLRDLTEAGVFRLAMPTDVGGYQADEDIVAEVLAQISRGCPSTGWMCTIMLISNLIPALLADEAADEIYATTDLRITATIAPTGQAVPVDGGYRVSGQWTWNTAGVHSNWFAPGCIVPGEEDSGPRLVLMPTTEVKHQDNWRAAGMAGTATNIATVGDVFVPAARTILVKDLAEGRYPTRRYSYLPYFNRPFALYINAGSAPARLELHAEQWTASCRLCRPVEPSPTPHGQKPPKPRWCTTSWPRRSTTSRPPRCSRADSAHCIAEFSKGHRRSWSVRRPVPISATSLACPGPVSISYSRPAVRRTPCLPPTFSGTSAISTCCISMRPYSPTAETRSTAVCWRVLIPTQRSSDVGTRST